MNLNYLKDNLIGLKDKSKFDAAAPPILVFVDTVDDDEG